MSPVKPPDYDESGLSLSAVDRTGSTDLHEQVAGEIRRAIADGEARPGERIPQAKDLAAVLGVHTNTVLRALRMLRDEGLLEVGRGRAIVVAGHTGARRGRREDEGTDRPRQTQRLSTRRTARDDGALGVVLRPIDRR